MAVSAVQKTAAQIESAFRKRGQTRLHVHARRGHAVVEVDDSPLARFTSGPGGQLRLSYRNHCGKWEPMPFVARDFDQAAQAVLEILSPHIETLMWD